MSPVQASARSAIGTPHVSLIVATIIGSLSLGLYFTDTTLGVFDTIVVKPGGAAVSGAVSLEGGHDGSPAGCGVPRRTLAS